MATATPARRHAARRWAAPARSGSSRASRPAAPGPARRSPGLGGAVVGPPGHNDHPQALVRARPAPRRRRQAVRAAGGRLSVRPSPGSAVAGPPTSGDDGVEEHQVGRRRPQPVSVGPRRRAGRRGDLKSDRPGAPPPSRTTRCPVEQTTAARANGGGGVLGRRLCPTGPRPPARSLALDAAACRASTRVTTAISLRVRVPVLSGADEGGWS